MQEESLKEIFSYDKDSGLLYWKISAAYNIRPGDIVGPTAQKDGYKRVGLDKKIYLQHRIIWALMTGEWPKNVIDHVNGDCADNRWSNLREATHNENMHNSKVRIGLKGVNFHKRTNKWVAQISLNKKKRHIGLFNSPEEAYAAYCRVAAEVHGEFSRIN